MRIPCRFVCCLVCCLVIGGSSRRAWGAADLIPTLTVAVSGGTVEYSVTVCNPMGPSGSFVAGLYFDRATAPACADTPDVELSYPNLQGGACKTEVQARHNTPAGTMTAWAFADSRCTVSEKNEGNNVTSQSYAVGSELSVASLAITAVDREVTFTVEVENRGLATGAPFSVGLYLHRSTAPRCGDSPDVLLAFDALALNQRASRTHVQSGAAAGSYSAWALADQGCAILEADKANNAATRPYDVGANLYVYNPTINTSGSSVIYGIEVCSWDASADSGPFSVGLWYDLTAAPSCGEAGADHVWSRSQLPLGSCQTLAHSREGAPPGDYLARFFGDPSCVLEESREHDNQRSRAYSLGAVLLPDLYFSGLTATVSGANVVYRADVCNQGPSAAAPVAVDLFFDRPSAPSCNTPADHRWTTGPLTPGACQSLTFTQTGAPPGTHRSWALADAACQQTEESESNNTISASYTVGQPDLVASTLSASISGSQVTFNALVCNAGIAVGGPFSVSLFFDRPSAPLCSQNPDFSTVLNGLGAGACLPVVATQGAAGPGDKAGWLFADALCQVVEGDETNNVLEHAYTVGGEQPDLRIATFAVEPAEDRVSFAATVCNNGKQPAAAFELGLFYSRSSEPSCGESPDWSSAVAGLAAGECVERSHTLQGVSGGTYQAWAKVDVACQVGESDEANNVSSQFYTVDAQVMDLQVTSLTVSGSAQQLTFIATICNGGTRATPETLTGFYHDRDELPASHCHDIPDQQAVLAPLDAGQCVNQSWVLADPPLGEHLAWVVADVACALMEPDETNNFASQRYAQQLVMDAGLADAGAPADASPARDHGMADAGPPPGEGCSCRQSSDPAPHSLGLVLLVSALWLLRRVLCQISKARRSSPNSVLLALTRPPR